MGRLEDKICFRVTAELATDQELVKREESLTADINKGIAMYAPSYLYYLAACRAAIRRERRARAAGLVRECEDCGSVNNECDWGLHARLIAGRSKL